MNEGAPVVAVMMPADMGGAVAARLRLHGARVVTNLQGRSARSVALSERAGVEDLGSDASMIAASNMILSIVTPDAALALAQRLAPSIAASRKPVVYADCNAISPDTSIQISDVIERDGGQYVDAGIIGPPPRTGQSRTIFYASGTAANEMTKLADYGLKIKVLGDRPGDASAVKMCYASLTKGTAALMTQLLVAAERLGIKDTLVAEFEASQGEQLKRMQQWVPNSVPKAFRWVAEMKEIAKTFQSCGIPAGGFEAAAETFAAVADTESGKMKIEAWADAGYSFDEVVQKLAKDLPTSPAH